MLEEIAEDGEYFDESFFLSLEDMDLGWRAQRAGWSCLFVGDAIAYHVRAVPNERGVRHLATKMRSSDASLRDRHGVKNRYLMMIKNESPRDLARDLPWLLPWEVIRLLGIAVLQPHALPGLIWFVRNARRAIRRRRKSAHLAGRGFTLRAWFGQV
jgi:GT2 family glycosyltransferase